jgi:hypothetical protein
VDAVERGQRHRHGSDDPLDKEEEAVTDTEALDLIHEIMLAEQWQPNAWAEIADVVRATGREL